MKLHITLISAFALLMTSTGLAKVTNDDIVILFENDVHGHMFGYSQLSELRKEKQQSTEDVCLVSLGDFAQGGPLCSVSHGEYAVDIMNHIGYDYVVIGNHEYDYGLEQLDKLTSTLNCTTLCCNYKDLRTDKNVFQSYAIRKFKNHKVAFIGCVTPITKISDSPHSFIDDQGNDIFTFGHEVFYDLIQKNVDECRALGADIVVLLAHLGDIDNSFETSEETIRRTRGIDVVLDGHAHNVINSREVKNLDGKDVLLTSTGCMFQNIGCLTISKDSHFDAELIPVTKVAKQDQAINELIASYQASFDNLPPICQSGFDLVAFDKEHDTYDRNCQTNLGSFCADAFRVMSRADIGWINAGGIRASIKSGKITFKELLGAFPFENRICVAEFSGQQILDALEYGVSRAPEDNGNYPQVSGLSFDLDINVNANILSDPTKPFAGVGDGPRRISNVKVLSQETDEYEPLDPKKFYSIASIDFILKNHGCSGILDNGVIIADYQMIDTQLMEDFIRAELKCDIPNSYAAKRNEKLSYKK